MITKVPVKILKDNDAVKGIVGKRVYAGYIPQQVPNPAIRIFTISDFPTNAKDQHAELYNYEVQVDVFSNNTEELEDLSGKVRDALAGYPGVDISVQGEGLFSIVYISAQGPIHENKAQGFRMILDFRITTKR